MTPSEIHNNLCQRLIREITSATDYNSSQANVVIESLLVGIAMFNYPNDARKQALLIQEIADAASDRAKAVQHDPR